MEQYATLHYQPGPRVYLYTCDQIVDMTATDPEAFWEQLKALGAYDEVVGIGQQSDDGLMGLETAWVDGSGKDWVYCPDPEALQKQARNYRHQLIQQSKFMHAAEEKELKGYLVNKGGPGSGNFDHAGRPGEVGGSTTGSGGGGNYPVSDAQIDNLFRTVHTDTSDMYLAYATVEGLQDDWERRMQMEKTLSKETGIYGGNINALMKVWNFAPVLDTHAGSSIINSISRQFDIPVSEYEQGRIAENAARAKKAGARAINNDYKANGYSEHQSPLLDEDMDKVTRQIYADTQSKLAQAGIAQMTMYRGGTKHGKNVISSWTLDRNLAAKFGDQVVEAVIPASRIFSLPSTGFGSPTQLEAVVLGESTNPAYKEAIDEHDIPDSPAGQIMDKEQRPVKVRRILTLKDKRNKPER